MDEAAGHLGVAFDHIAQIAAEAAAALGVTSDWLLGLTDQPDRLADLMANALTLSEAPRALIDETIFGWHQEAAGYKIRHVPATLPDMLKTRAVVEWEYEPQLGRTAEQAIGAFEHFTGRAADPAERRGAVVERAGHAGDVARAALKLAVSPPAGPVQVAPAQVLNQRRRWPSAAD